MCEKAKTIGDPENQDILNRLCKLLERRLAKKKEKDTGGTGKRNAGLVRLILIRARTHDSRTRATHVPTRSTTWTLTDHTFDPLGLTQISGNSFGNKPVFGHSHFRKFPGK
jgi:hypothetical protein